MSMIRDLALTEEARIRADLLLLADQDLSNQVRVIRSTDDPSAVATVGEKGSLLINLTSGSLWVKKDSGSSTNWKRVVENVRLVGDDSGVVTLEHNDAVNVLGGEDIVSSVSGDSLSLDYNGLWRSPVEDKDLNTPPGSPTPNVRYIVGGTPTDDWVGHASEVARWSDGDSAWVFTTPTEGMAVWVKDEDLIYVYYAAVWNSLASGASSLDDLTDVNTTGATAARQLLEYYHTDGLWYRSNWVFNDQQVSTVLAAGSNLLSRDMSVIASLNHPISVLDLLDTPPGGPTTGDRYLVGTAPTGAWVGLDNQIVEYNGSTWDNYEPVDGSLLYVEDVQVVYYFAIGSPSPIVDGSWNNAAPIADGNKGDITVASSGASWTINAFRRSIVVPASAMWISTTSGASALAKAEQATNKQNIQTFTFSGLAKQYVEFTYPMPENWDGGSLYVKFYWTSAAVDSGGVRWGIECRSYGDAETIDQAWGTAQEVTDSLTATAYQVFISPETAAMIPSGTPAAGELLHFRAYRDPAHGGDTELGTAELLAVKIEYSVSQIGE